MIESWFQLDNIEDDSLLFGTDYDEPRLFFNKTTKFGFEYPARFNKTSVALLSGAILFVLINTAFLIMYINSKQPAPTKKPPIPLGPRRTASAPNSTVNNIAKLLVTKSSVVSSFDATTIDDTTHDTTIDSIKMQVRKAFILCRIID